MPRLLAWWSRMPLYIRIVIGLVLGVVAGLLLGPSAAKLDVVGQIVLRVLGAIAPVLILVAVVRALMAAQIRGRDGVRLFGLLLLNTLVAIGIGLAVANTIQPGAHANLSHPETRPTIRSDVGTQILENIPESFVRPFVDNKVIGVVLIAVAFGIALRRQSGRPRQVIEDLVNVGFETILVVLHWVIALVPLAVFAKIASVVGTKGFRPFLALGIFVVAVLLALLLQTTWYLVRIRVGSWVRPVRMIAAMKDALVMAFSTASSTATMPVTYELLLKNVRLRERSAGLGALVGANFNNDGTALYEAMAALFIAQAIGVELSLTQQLMVVVTSVIASVGAAGIPEAGLVTMTLVFTAVGLPTEYIVLLLTVDWFLDRCRTTINVLGDVNVACLLDGRVPEAAAEPPPVPAAPLDPKPEL